MHKTPCVLNLNISTYYTPKLKALIIPPIIKNKTLIVSIHFKNNWFLLKQRNKQQKNNVHFMLLKKNGNFVSLI